jgi:hypothetical protein
MSFENYVLEAIDRVLDWEISADALGQAVSAQAALMAHIRPEQLCCSDDF